jgi:DNA polymerase III delta prime subunit
MNDSSLFSIKYCPSNIDDFAIDDVSKEVIKSCLHINTLNLLIQGIHGSGKTTLINHLIHEYYNHNELWKENVLFIHSLEKQDLSFYNKKVKLFSQTFSLISSKKKIIVIDDLHLLPMTFQIILSRYFDLYHKNIVFLSTCIHVENICDNLQSRFYLVSLKPMTENQSISLCKHILENEKIDYEEGVLDKLLLFSNQSIQTLIHNIEKMYLLNKKLTNQDMEMLFHHSYFFFEQWIQNIPIKSVLESIREMISFYNQGYSVIDIIDFFSFYIENNLRMDALIKIKIFKLICEYIQTFYAIHENEIELVFFVYHLKNILS